MTAEFRVTQSNLKPELSGKTWGLKRNNPNVLDGGICLISADVPLIHYGITMGVARGCFDISVLIGTVIFSPMVFLVAILLIVAIRLASSLSVVDYRQSVLKTLQILGDWSRNDARENNEVFPLHLANNKDPVTAQMLVLVRDGVNLRLQNQRSQDELDAAKGLAVLASQVAHDIRSPLAALDVLSGQLDRFPEEIRTLTRSAIVRIRDIANHLLEKYRMTTEVNNRYSRLANGNTVGQLQSHLLYGIIDSLLTEKRIQFRSRANVAIVMDILPESYNLSAKVEPTELKRMLSNLVDNAVEAIVKDGTVVVALRDDGEFISLTIEDDGMGIPEHVKPMLGQRGATFNKVNGNGYGLFHAHQCMQSWNGKIKIDSMLTRGSKVAVQLPRSAPPKWYVDKLKIVRKTTIVILDDDRSIHELWDTRFRSLPEDFRKDLSVLHFFDYASLKCWKLKIDLPENVLFLVDYELLGEQTNGLDAIVTLGIEPQSFLVTSRYEDRSIIDRCETIGLGVIPKNVAGFISIEATTEDASSFCILIEDNPIIHMAWRTSAQKENVSLHAFERASDFFSQVDRFALSTPVYVDYCLGDGQPTGEWVAEQIHQLGFENIFLATGYLEEEIEVAPWIKGVIGKSPPWK